jgi:hypothetical protein
LKLTILYVKQRSSGGIGHQVVGYVTSFKSKI